MRLNYFHPSWHKLILLLSCLSLPISLSMGSIPSKKSNYTFISQELMLEASKAAPFLMPFKDLYQHFQKPFQQKEAANLLDWQKRTCAYADTADIRIVVYDLKRFELESIKSYWSNKSGELAGRLKDNDFADYLIDLGCKETVDYLLFTRKCETHVTRRDDEWDERTKNIGAMQALVKDGLRAFRKTQSHYIKLRYAYQIVRLVHYMGDFQEAIRLFDFLLPKIDDTDSPIYYWLLGHKAGAIQALGDNVEAAYLYAVIFKNAPELRQTAVNSFVINTDEEWQACYLKCKDNEERAALFTMRASKPQSRIVEEMRNIYTLEPKSDLLELLLVKELQHLEQEIMGLRKGVGNRKHLKTVKRELTNTQGQRLIELQSFARNCRIEGKVKHINLWHLAEGYLEYLAGDYYAARKTFSELKNNLQDKILKNQLKALVTLLDITQIDRLTKESRLQLLGIFQEEALIAAYPDLGHFLTDKIAELYQKARRPGIAFKAHYTLKDLKYNPQHDIIDDLLQTIERPDTLSKLDLQLSFDPLTAEAKDDLLDIKATLLMSEHQYSRALEVLNLMDRGEWRDYGEFSPFVEKFFDCVFCDEKNGLVIDTSRLFSRGEILETIIKAESRARLGADNPARIYYNIGNALYNMSYYGHQWRAMDYFRSGANQYINRVDNVVDDLRFPYGNLENTNVTRAKAYFVESIIRAEEAENWELAAKATFMAAKCEQKEFYLDPNTKLVFNNNIPAAPPEYLTYFNKLEEDYYETQFYKEIIEECKYFAAFAK